MRLWFIKSKDARRVQAWLKTRTDFFTVVWNDYNPLIMVKVVPQVGRPLITWLKKRNVKFLHKIHYGLDKKVEHPKKHKPLMEQWR